MVEIDKTITKTMTATTQIKWILSDTGIVPVAPTGYTRDASLDIDLGVLGTLYAFTV